MDLRAQVADYLDLLKMKYKWNDEESCFELIFTERKDEQPAAPEPTEDSDLYFKYTIKIGIGERWVQVYCDIYPLDKIPKEKREEVLLDLLSFNRKYAEVCFDYDESTGVIGTSQEQMVQGFNFDGFREEFFAVPWAVKKFWSDIAKKHGLT